MKRKYVFMPLKLIDMYAFEDYLNRMMQDGYMLTGRIFSYCIFEKSDEKDVYFRVSYLRHVSNWDIDKKYHENTVLVDLMGDFEYEYVADIEPLIVFKSKSPNRIFIDDDFDADTFNREVKREMKEHLGNFKYYVVGTVIFIYLFVTSATPNLRYINTMLIIDILFSFYETMINYVRNRRFLEDRNFNKVLKIPTFPSTFRKIIFPALLVSMLVDLEFSATSEQFVLTAFWVIVVVMILRFVYLYIMESVRRKKYNNE